MRTLNMVSFLFLVIVTEGAPLGNLTDPPVNGKPRIVGGGDAEESDAPYQISLQILNNDDLKYKHFCGGAIIDQQWILTASHCVDNMNARDLIVVTGANQWFSPGALYYLDKISMYANYTTKSFKDDIALLHLNTSIAFNDKTQPVSISDEPINDDDEVILTGWGTVGKHGNYSDHLQKIAFKFLSHEKCKEVTNNDPGLDVGHVCSYSIRGEGACFGDSGGPLVRNGHLVGVLNWGDPCGTGFPDMYASISYYRDWILRTTDSLRSR